LPSAPPATGEIFRRITLKEIGVQRAVELRGPHSYSSLSFVLPYAEIPRQASLRVTYHFNRFVGPHAGAVQVRLNRASLGTLEPIATQREDQYDTVDLALPADMLVRRNELTFEFNGNAVLQTEEKARSVVLAEIGDSSIVQIQATTIPFKNDVSLLPLPLFDSDLQTETTIPFVFLTQPDAKTLQAA